VTRKQQPAEANAKNRWNESKKRRQKQKVFLVRTLTSILASSMRRSFSWRSLSRASSNSLERSAWHAFGTATASVSASASPDISHGSARHLWGIMAAGHWFPPAAQRDD
jgi:hypothetical protein